MCKELGAPAAPHHIFAGVSSIFASDNRPVDLNLVALIITMYLLVLTRLTGVETTAEEYLQRRETAMEATKEAMIRKGERMECEETDVDRLHAARKDVPLDINGLVRKCGGGFRPYWTRYWQWTAYG